MEVPHLEAAETSTVMKHLASGMGLLVAASLLMGCTVAPRSVPADDSVVGNEVPQRAKELGQSPWAQQSSLQGGIWRHYSLPGKASSQFSYTRKDGRDAVAATAYSSASMVRKVVRVEPADLRSVRFSWKVPELIAQADAALRDADDSPVRIVLAFEGDRAKLSAKNRALSELAQALTGEPMPYATLMYIWCGKRAPGSVVINPRTDRIRAVVVESGVANLNQWLEYERDIRADFEKAYGEAPGALVGIGLMTDSDNTRTSTAAWYGAVQLAKPGQSLTTR